MKPWPGDQHRRMIRDLVLALSLANLGFYKLWQELFYRPLPSEVIYLKGYPAPLHFCGAILDLFLLTALLWGVAQLARSSERSALIRAAQAAFVLLTAAFVGDIPLVHLKPHVPMAWRAVILYGMAPCLLLLFVLTLCFCFRRLVSFCVLLVLILSPFVLVTLGRSIGRMVSPQAIRTNRYDPLAPLLPVVKGSPRVLLLLFDELDERMTFLERPAGVNLPELDRFHSESVYAENAHAPEWCTELSLPSFLTGKIVHKNRLLDKYEAMLTLDGSDREVLWSSLPSFFSKARSLGFNTALVGWFRPYGRFYVKDLNYYFWETVDAPRIYLAETLPEIMRQCAARIFPFQKRRDHIDEYLGVRRRALEIVADPVYGLTMIHFPVPHAPYIYDRQRQKFTWFANSVSGFLDNLVLADRTLGDVRRRMEADGLWDDTAVVVFADHYWRAAQRYDGRTDKRAVFMVKMPHQKSPVLYSQPFNTVLLHDLTIALLNREVVHADQLVRWLDQRRGGEEKAR